MDLNKVIKLSSRTFDVAGIDRAKRILYFREEGKIIIKSNANLAKLHNDLKFGGRAEILSPKKAARLYPEVFKDSSKKKPKAEKRTIMLSVPSEMYDFCCRQGNITAYLQSLIRREMKRMSGKLR